MGARQSGMHGPRGPPPDIAVEILASLIVSTVALLAGTVAVKALDPNRGAKKKADAVKRDIARRLGRPNIVTTPYEDMIATDVANPNAISTTFDEIGGLGETKRALQEIVILPLLRPELFSGGSLLKPVKGCMLYGPPGTGKTLLAKALAKECQACFINVRSSTLQSKWFGDANKLVAAVFSLAWKLQPSIIFIDEVDSFLGARKGSEHEASTSMKTEFMTMWDGFQTNENARVMVLAATNRPWEVDEAILRRLPRSFEVGLPNLEQRIDIIKVILKDEHMEPGFFGPGPDPPVLKIAKATDRYSGSDLKELCKSAAMGPIRDLLASEARDYEARKKKRAQNSGPRLDDAGRIVSLDEFEDANDDDDADYWQRPSRSAKRPMGLADFAEVLSKTGTSADAAATYRHAEQERAWERDRRGASAHAGGFGTGSPFGGGSGFGGNSPAVDASQLMQFVHAMMAPGGGSQDGGSGANTPGGGASATGSKAGDVEITPELIEKLKKHMAAQGKGAASGGANAN